MNAFLVKVNKKILVIKLERVDLTHCEEDLFMTSAELVTLPEQVAKKLILAYKSVISGNKLSAETLSVKSSMADK
ncbi:51_t:CDS:2 [Funneliformis mosseae]|uniref:51_t:CDS:1 n=1 Tax=Funneliformis mosseae TaxID=27381 RepID=A0A9N9HCS3_FUNMO|nr:51_t:CDS:2 [Funneliformis mosseae]